MPEEIVIGEYEPADREGCIELLRKTFPRTSDETGSRFSWRFEDPGRRKPLIICGKHNGRVVAFCSWLPWEFRYNDIMLLGYQNGEAATDINYRGKGILSRMLRLSDEKAAERGADFFFCYPNEKSYGPTIKAGFEDAGLHYFRLRVINPLKVRTKQDSSLYGAYPFDASLHEKNKLTPQVDEVYCAWRYAANMKNYEMLSYTESGQSAIFCIRFKKWKGLNEALLLDAQFTSYDNGLIDRAIQYLDSSLSRKVFYLRTFFNESSERGKALRRYFPIPVKSRFYNPCVKAKSDRIDKKIISDLAFWDVMPHCVDEL